MPNPPTADYIEERKRAELAAMAEGGERARQAYLDAESKANTQHQASLDSELGFARSRNFGAPAEDAIRQIIDGAHMQSIGDLERNRQIGDQHLWDTSVSEGGFMDRQKELVPLLQAELEAARAGGGGGGGGGGGRGGGGGGRGGSGGGGGDDDWYKALRVDAGGLKSFIPDYLAAASRGYGDPRSPRDLRSRQFAMDAYGVPEYALDQISPIRGYLAAGISALNQAKAGTLKDSKGGAVRTRQGFVAGARQLARETPGNQVKGRQYLQQLARETLPAKKKPKKKGR